MGTETELAALEHLKQLADVSTHDPRGSLRLVSQIHLFEIFQKTKAGDFERLRLEVRDVGPGRGDRYLASAIRADGRRVSGMAIDNLQTAIETLPLAELDGGLPTDLPAILPEPVLMSL
jgi:hypothetical protein